MMKKMLFLALFYALYGIANLSAQVTIGVDKEPSQWSLLDLKEASDGISAKALHLPRLTTVARNDLTASEKTLTYGLLIYNVTTNCLEYWNLQKWVSLCAGQANVTFTNPDGTGAGDITQPPFPAAGGSKGPYVPHDEPECTGKDPAYSFLMISGDDYTDIFVENSATGQFSLSMNVNETAVPRHAIIRVSNNCTGEYKEFIFTQEGDISSCGTTLSIPDIMSENSLNLCTGGAVYLYLDGHPSSGTYIWTLGEVEKGRGSSYVATVPGTYKVYADRIGCTTAVSKTATVTSGSTGAPSPVSIIVSQNNGFVCDPAGETKLYASASAGTIVWYQDGSKTGKTGPSIDAGIGVWFAVVEDGGCSSTPSNTVTVSLDPNHGQSIPTPDFTINGAASGGTINLCSGGTLVLDVTNAQAGVTYTWLLDNTEKGSGTHYEMSLAGVTSGFVLQCRATGAACSSAGTSVVNISVGSAPSQPNITVNTPGDAVCDGTATLTANVSDVPDSYIWYRSESQNGTYSIVPGETNQTLVIIQEGWYKVAAKSGNCVSELSGAKGITVSSGAASATISGDQTGINPGDTRTYTAAMNNPQGASYSWTISGDANPTPTSGTGSSIAVRFSSAGTATINLTAQNACGTATVTNNNYAVTVSPLCTPAGISSHSPAGKAVTVTRGSISGSLSITASGSPTLSYKWYSNTTASNSGGSVVAGATAATFTIPTTLVSGSYYYYCEVTSNCGGSSTAKSDPFTVTVNPNPEGFQTGSGSFAGRTCFDVAQANNGGECGTLSYRQGETLTANGSLANFSNTVTRNQTYTFTPSSTVSNVRFYAVEAGAYNGQIIESVTGGNPNNNISSAVSCNIVYKSDLNGRASGKNNANALTVNIYVVYNDNATNTGTDKQLKLTASIKDCACCGALTTGGAWLSFMCYNLGADATLATPDQIKGAQPSKTYGNFYQWGKNKGWSSSGAISGWATGNNTNVSAAGGNSNNAAWGSGGNKGSADPCPTGWRVPSNAQWKSIFSNSVSDGQNYNNGSATVNTWTWSNNTTNGLQIGRLLFLPGAGHRTGSNGGLFTQGVRGNYWTNTPSGTNSLYMYFMDDNKAYMGQSNTRAYGFSVRCVKE
jgi:uncharacterized protein (TIGR02145 family)